MAKVLNFQLKKKSQAEQAELTRLLKLSDQVDEIILETLQKGLIEPKELVGILAHRLGTLISHFDNKEMFLQVCIEVLSKQVHTRDKGA